MPALITPQALQKAVNQGFERVENFRRARAMFVQEYVGPFYDKERDADAQPINLIFKAVSILVPHLVAKNPQFNVESRYAMYAGTAELLELYLEDLAKKLGIKAELRDVIVDAIMCMGIIKDGLGVSGQSLDGPDGMMNVAMPYAKRVDLDDFTLDPMCRSIREAVFIGNRVRVPRAMYEESGLYGDPEDLPRLPGVTEQHRKGKEVEQLSRKKTHQGDENDLIDYVDLVEVYLPDDRKVVTLPFSEHLTDRFLRVVDWDGPDPAGDCPSLGPYHFLGFHWVPNNPFPVPPAGVWMDLHEMANDNAAKANRQAQRQKDVLVYGRAAADDAERIVETSDGESCAVDHPDQVRTISMGGVNDDVYRHLDWIKQEFGESGPGDFQQLGGEVSSADTATQANLLASAANIRVGDMKDIIYDFTGSVGRSLAWYGFTDPLIETPLKKRVPGGEDITLILTPEAIRGDFLDYHYSITMDSMDRENPVQRSQKLIQFVQTVIPTAVQTFMQFAQMGMPGMFNPIRFVNINAKLQGIDHFEAVWNDPEFQMQVMEMMARSPIIQGAVGMPGDPTGAGVMVRSILGQGNDPVPQFQGQGLDPNADPQASAAQAGSAPLQLGLGNLSGLPAAV